MGNMFSAAGSTGPRCVELSNGSTDVFFDVLTLAGCVIAETPWDRNLVLHFADGHRWGRGTAGFDLAELPWTSNWPAEKAFLDRVIGLALTRHGWDRLTYDPPYAIQFLTTFREMVAGYTPTPVHAPEWGDWRVPPLVALTVGCEIHGVFIGELGCRLCDRNIQPLC